jgi:hypothetical protein
MSITRIDIEYLVGGLEVSGHGISEEGKTVSLPEEVANSLVIEGIAKLKGKGKINKKPEGDK